MAKRKRKRSNGNKSSWIGRFFGGTVRLVVKVAPLAVLMLLVGTLFSGVRQALYADPALSVHQITVNPPDALSGARRQSLEAETLGRNILKLDLKALSHDLERNAMILKATVVRELPDQIRIDIRHRVPFAYVKLKGRDGYGLVSEDGVILDLVTTHDPSRLLLGGPGVENTPASIGARLDNRGFEAAVAFIKVLNDHPFTRYERIARMDLNHLGYVTLFLEGGPEIRMGRDPLKKLTELERVIPLLETDERTKIDYIDLQFDDVVVKRKGWWQ